MLDKVKRRGGGVKEVVSLQFGTKCDVDWRVIVG